MTKGKRKVDDKNSNGQNSPKRSKNSSDETSDSAKLKSSFPNEIPLYSSFENGLKIVSWNTASLTASIKKGLWRYLDAENADIVLLQEIKNADDAHISKELKAATIKYPFRYYWHSTSKKGYSGVAIWSKVKPINVSYGFPNDKSYMEDDEGRLMTIEFPRFYLINCYVPNAGQGLKRMDMKMKWNVSMKKYLWVLEKEKPVVWAGDLNVALTEKDLARPKSNWNKTPGYTEKEIDSFNDIIKSDNAEFVDVWRNLHPEDNGLFTTDDLFKFNNVNLDPLTETYNISFYLSYMARWPNYFYVAESPGNQIMGYIMGKAEGLGTDWHGHVTALTVASNQRRIKLAKKLMWILEQVSEKIYNGYFVDLFVRQSNKVAIKMYEKFGYTVYRRVIDYYSGSFGDEDAYDMRRALPRDKDKISIIPLGRPVQAWEVT